MLKLYKDYHMFELGYIGYYRGEKRSSNNDKEWPEGWDAAKKDDELELNFDSEV